jgi:hypothetical protein
MSSFTHLICDSCWAIRCYVRNEIGRVPTRLQHPETEPCCVCGLLTGSGIYFRENPANLSCRHTRETP